MSNLNVKPPKSHRQWGVLIIALILSVFLLPLILLGSLRPFSNSNTSSTETLATESTAAET